MIEQKFPGFEELLSIKTFPKTKKRALIEIKTSMCIFSYFGYQNFVKHISVKMIIKLSLQPKVQSKNENLGFIGEGNHFKQVVKQRYVN